MDTQLFTVLISTSGSVIVGVVGMFFTANQPGEAHRRRKKIW